MKTACTSKVQAVLRLLQKRLFRDNITKKSCEGAKEMLLVERVDDPAFLRKLFDGMYHQLPAPKKQKEKR